LIGGFSLSVVEFFLSATKRMHKEFFSSEFGRGGKATLAKMSQKKLKNLFLLFLMLFLVFSTRTHHAFKI
jgi:hypothetical protein